MEGILGGVFASHHEDSYAWMSANLLEPIHEERFPTARHEADVADLNPSPKRQRTGFDCERCGRTFTEKRSLARHRLYAGKCKGGSEPLERFPCDHCSKVFARDDVRQRHEREQHFKVKRPQPRLNLLPDHHRHAVNHVRSEDVISSTPHDQIVGRGLPTDHLLVDRQQRNHWRLDTASIPSTSPGTTVSSIIASRSESNTSPSIGSTAFRRRWSGSTGSDMSSGSSVKCSTTNTSFTTFGSDADHHSVAAETCDSGSRASRDDDWLSSRRISFDEHTRRDLVKGGASARPASQRKSRICPICNKSFGHTVEEVRSHLARHSLQGQGEHKCQLCQLGFVHKADLDFHLLSARDGSCGLQFEHTKKCTGHHPPTPDQLSMSDSDRMRLPYCFQHWEQSQLQDYSAVVNDVIDYVSSRTDCWSVDGAVRKSIQSVSILFSGLDIRSTPECMEHHVRTAMHRVRRTVSNRLPIGPDASLRIRLGKKSANDVRLGKALVEAAGMDDLSKVKELIRRGAPVNSAYALSDDMAACTPLMAAVCGGSKDTVEYLLENGSIADGLSTQDKSTVTTPLCLAAARGDIEIVRCLLDYRADINKEAQDNAGNAACHAARNGHTDILSLLLDLGANIHLQATVEVDGRECVSSTPLSTGNVLAIAVHNDRLDAVKMLLDRSKIGFDYCDASGSLAMAAYQGNMAMIQLLLSTHTYLCAFTALWIADSQGHKAVVDAIVDHQQRVKQQMPPESTRILKRAMKRGLGDLTCRMLSPRDDHSELCDEGLFPCRYYEAKAAYSLIAQTHPNLASMSGFDLAMALNCAVYYGDLKAARALLKAGLSANAEIYPSNRRYLATNLSLATRLGHFDMVILLLQYGANPKVDDNLSLDLLEAALESHNVQVLRTLFSTEATFLPKQDELSCSSFNAAIQRVVEAGYIEMLQALFEGGLDVNQSHVEDRSGRKTTLLHLAAYQVPDEGSFETVKLLLENGADPRIQVSSRTASDVVYSQCMGLEESDEAFLIIKRTIDLLEFWESRISINELGSAYSQKAI